MPSLTHRAARRRAAMAALLAGLPALAAAQEGGRGANARQVVILEAPSKVTRDSIAVLFRQIQNLPYGSAEWQAMARQLEAIMPPMPMTLRAASAALPRGWLGINTQGPHSVTLSDNGEVIRYFDYPMIVAVDPASPAEHAGIAPGDLLLAYNGLDVRGREFNLNQLLAPERPLAVTVRHDGEPRDYKIVITKVPSMDAQNEAMQTVLAGRAASMARRESDSSVAAEARVLTQARRLVEGAEYPPLPARGGFGVPGGAVAVARAGGRGMVGSTIAPMAAAMFGASFVTVSGDLARALKIDSGLVANQVAGGAQFANAGLRPGDRLVSIGGQPVATFREMSLAIMSRRGESSVIVDVMRDHKPVKLTLAW